MPCSYVALRPYRMLCKPHLKDIGALFFYRNIFIW
nr:MAG TPA: hypothetical protein [Caudoviricetes sp.]